MNKKDLIDSLSRKMEISGKEAKKVVDLVFQRMTDFLVHGNRVEIRGLGSFTVKNYKGYEGRKPKPDQVVTFPISKINIGKQLLPDKTSRC